MWLSVLPSFELRIAMGEDLESNAKAPPPMQAPRSRLLLSCGESVLAVAASAYRRVETMACPVGCLARGVSHVAGPVLRPLRLRCLSALSFVDRQLLVAQDVAAVLFPRAERVLRKVDGLFLLVESLPVRFDGAADGHEALVAGVRSGAAAKRPCRDGKGAGDVFRDIRCDEDAGGAARRDVEKVCEDVTREAESLVEVVTVTVDDSGDGGEAGYEKKTIGIASLENITGETRCEDVTREAASLEVVTVTVDGGGGDDGGAGDDTKNICVAPAENITGETRCNEEMEHSGTTGDDHFKPSSVDIDHDDDDHAAQVAYTEAMHPEAEKQEAAGSEESEEEGEPMEFDMTGAEQRAEVRVEQDGRSLEVVETHAAETMEPVQSTGREEVESQQVASPEAGTSGKESKKDGDLLDLFDEAWGHKLA